MQGGKRQEGTGSESESEAVGCGVQGLAGLPHPCRPCRLRDPSPSIWRCGWCAPRRVTCVGGGSPGGLSVPEPVAQMSKGHRGPLPYRPPKPCFQGPQGSMAPTSWQLLFHSAGHEQVPGLERRGGRPHRGAGLGLQPSPGEGGRRAKVAAWHHPGLSSGKHAALGLLASEHWLQRNS